MKAGCRQAEAGGELRREDALIGEDLDSRSSVGFANPGPTDNAVAWCALWGISQLPTVPRVNATAITSGHAGRGRQETFYLPYWIVPWRPPRVRTILASQRLRTLAEAATTSTGEAPQQLAAHAWLQRRGILGIVAFPVERFGSDNAPERRAMLGQPLPTSPA